MEDLCAHCDIPERDYDPIDPEVARRKKSEAAKKAWERRKANGKCQRSTHIS